MLKNAKQKFTGFKEKVSSTIAGFRENVISMFVKGQRKLQLFHVGERGEGGGVPGWVIGIVVFVVLALVFLGPAKEMITNLMNQSNSKVQELW